MNRNKRIRLLLFIFLMAGAHRATAQSVASISGIVRDPQGKAVADAAVAIFARGGVDRRDTTSDAGGGYRFDRLPEGEYILQAEALGFARFVTEEVRLDRGANLTRDLQLQLAGIQQLVVVTASGTPQTPEEVSKAVSVVDRQQMDQQDSLAISDVLQSTAGLRVQQLGGPGAFTSIQIRGLRNEDTAVLIDGIRFRDAAGTQGDASGLLEDMLVTNVDHVEVLRGSGSSLYGTDAIGGVVNIITDQGGGRTRGSLLLEGGSLGTFRGRAQVAGSFQQDRIQYSFGVTQLDVTSGVDGDDPFRNTSVQGRATFLLTPLTRLVARLYAGNSFGKINSDPDVIGTPPGTGIINAIPLAPAVLRLYEQGTPISQLNVGNATFIPAPDDPDSTRAARFISGALILTGQVSPALDYSLSYQALSTSRRYDNGPAGVGFQPEDITRSLYDGRIQTANAHVDYRLGPFNLLTGGYEFESENYSNDNTDQSNPAAASGTSVTQLSHSVYAQDQVRLFDDRLQFSGGFRAQYFTFDVPAFSPAASAPYQGISFPSPAPAYTGDGSAAYFFRKSGTKVRAHIGRGYRAPSLYERFGTGFDPVFGYSVYGDPRLHPEHSISLDGGVDQTFWQGRLKTSATYFYTWLQNVITFDTSGLINPLTDPFGRSIGYINTQGGISRGVELNAALFPIRSLSISAAYTFVNAMERVPIVGNTLQTFVVPRVQFSVVAAERVTSRLLLTFDLRASDSYLAPVYGEVTTQVFRFDGIHKVNFGASYRIPLGEFKAIRFFARAENLFNQTYFESGFLTPGRMGTGGMQYEF